MRQLSNRKRIYRDSRDRIKDIQDSFQLSDEELMGVMLVSPQTTRNWVSGQTNTGKSMYIHRQRLDMLVKATHDPYEHAVISTALSRGGVGGLSALLMYCLCQKVEIKKAVKTKQFMWVSYYLTKDFREYVQSGLDVNKAYRMTSCQMLLSRVEGIKKLGRKL